MWISVCVPFPSTGWRIVVVSSLLDAVEHGPVDRRSESQKKGKRLAFDGGTNLPLFLLVAASETRSGEGYEGLEILLHALPPKYQGVRSLRILYRCPTRLQVWLSTRRWIFDSCAGTVWNDYVVQEKTEDGKKRETNCQEKKIRKIARNASSENSQKLCLTQASISDSPNDFLTKRPALSSVSRDVSHISGRSSKRTQNA